MDVDNQPQYPLNLLVGNIAAPAVSFESHSCRFTFKRRKYVITVEHVKDHGFTHSCEHKTGKITVSPSITKRGEEYFWLCEFIAAQTRHLLHKGKFKAGFCVDDSMSAILFYVATSGRWRSEWRGSTHRGWNHGLKLVWNDSDLHRMYYRERTNDVSSYNVLLDLFPDQLLNTLTQGGRCWDVSSDPQTHWVSSSRVHITCFNWIGNLTMENETFDVKFIPLLDDADYNIKLFCEVGDVLLKQVVDGRWKTASYVTTNTIWKRANDWLLCYVAHKLLVVGNCDIRLDREGGTLTVDNHPRSKCIS